MLYAKIIEEQIEVDGEKVSGFYLNFFGSTFEGDPEEGIYQNFYDMRDGKERIEGAFMKEELLGFLADNSFTPISSTFFYKNRSHKHWFNFIIKKVRD